MQFSSVQGSPAQHAATSLSWVQLEAPFHRWATEQNLFASPSCAAKQGKELLGRVEDLERVTENDTKELREERGEDAPILLQGVGPIGSNAIQSSHLPMAAPVKGSTEQRVRF